MKPILTTLFITGILSIPAYALDDSLNDSPPDINNGETIGGGGAITGRIVNSDVKAAYDRGYAGSGYGRYRVIYPYLQQYTNQWRTVCKISSGSCKTTSSNFAYDTYILRATGIEHNAYRRNGWIEPFSKTTTLTGWVK